MSRLPSLAEDDRFRATFYLHRGYICTLIGLAAIIAFITGLWLLAGLLGEVFSVSDVASYDWIWTLGPLLVSLAVITFHYTTYLRSPAYQAMQTRFGSIPPPPFIGATPPPATAEAVAATPAAAPSVSVQAGSPSFCSHCGGRLAEGSSFVPAAEPRSAVSEQDGPFGD